MSWSIEDVDLQTPLTGVLDGERWQEAYTGGYSLGVSDRCAEYVH